MVLLQLGYLPMAPFNPTTMLSINVNISLLDNVQNVVLDNKIIWNLQLKNVKMPSQIRII